MGLSKEAIIGLVTLIVTFPSSFLLSWSWINRRKAAAARIGRISIFSIIAYDGIVSYHCSGRERQILVGRPVTPDPSTSNPVDVELGLGSAVIYHCQSVSIHAVTTVATVMAYPVENEVP
jgi:hypothetical protein